MTVRSHPLETALQKGLRRLLLSAATLAVVAFVFPAPAAGDALLVYNMIHLLVLLLATLGLTAEVAVELDQPWFPQLRKSWLASAASLVAVATGFAALLALATSAAARYDVSLQFLQLLSALDIAWVSAALFFGSARLWSRLTAWLAGLAIILACIGSIVAYLATVGFTPGGGWLVSGPDMMRIVIPADTVAAIISITVLLRASKDADQPMEQPSPQS